MPHAYVLQADLVKSRRVGQRRRLQADLAAALEAVATDRDAWLAPLVVAKGVDELSGVLRDPSAAVDAVVAVNLAVWPQRFRFALGWGDIDVAFETRHAPAMDGDAFHRTADAIARARKEGIPFALAIPHVAAHDAAIVEALIRLHGHIQERWTPREAQVVRLHRELGAQRPVADRLGVTQQAVSDALRRAGAARLEAAERAVRDWLGHVRPPDRPTI